MDTHIKIRNTLNKLDTYFAKGCFEKDAWLDYIEEILPSCSKMFIEDASVYDFDKVCLPIINQVFSSKEKVKNAVSSFEMATEGIEDKIVSRFGKTVDCEIILYLGLCNGAGWVTSLSAGRTFLWG